MTSERDTTNNKRQRVQEFPGGRDTVSLPDLPLKTPDALHEQAIALINKLDPQAADEIMRIIRFDDSIYELASRRGLLVHFNIRTASGYDEFSVEAPEFMTIDYLRRRIVRAKLQKGEYITPNRFIVRRKVEVPGGSAVMEDVRTKLPNNDEQFLANAGFQAPNRYDIYLSSAPISTDLEQQEKLLSKSGSVKSAPTISMDPATAQYQALLRGDLVMHGHSNDSVPPPPSLFNEQLVAAAMDSAAVAGLGAAPVAGIPAAALQIRNGIAMINPDLLNKSHVSNAGNLEKMGQQFNLVPIQPDIPPSSQEKKRREVGRWTSHEVDALIEGVRRHGTLWAQIRDDCIKENVISEKRNQVDYKDKWRNLVKAATNHTDRANRPGGLTEKQKASILVIVYGTGESLNVSS